MEPILNGPRAITVAPLVIATTLLAREFVPRYEIRALRDGAVFARMTDGRDRWGAPPSATVAADGVHHSQRTAGRSAAVCRLCRARAGCLEGSPADCVYSATPRGHVKIPLR